MKEIPASTSHISLLLPTNEVLGKVIFLHLSVILFKGRGCAPGGCAPGGCLVPGGLPAPGGAWWRPPGYCCGRYTSYWNAFLLKIGLFGSKSVNSLKTNTTCIPCENKSLLLLLLNFLKNKILSAVTIAQGGVLPNIQAVLLPKKSNKPK